MNKLLSVYFEEIFLTLKKKGANAKSANYLEWQ